MSAFNGKPAAANGKPATAAPLHTGGHASAQSSETGEWNQLTAVIEAALAPEYREAQRRPDQGDDGSPYPALTVGPEVMPAPGSKDWRKMTPAGSAAQKDAAADPQTPEQYRDALAMMAELRPPLPGVPD
jgi:hypothetical protein